jgi:gamma-glutamylcyclotransferase
MPVPAHSCNLPIQVPPSFLYFAYGSNMSARRLQARTPSATPVGAAELPGYKLVFDKRGRDGSAKADCERTGAPTDLVLGGLYQIKEGERSALDQAEGLGNGYDAVEIVLNTDQGPMRALTYVATDKQPGLVPYGWYMQHVLTGAREFGLPESYTASVAGVASRKDPDAAREASELSIYAESGC